MARPMVMRSRFFSMTLVPVWVEYMEFRDHVRMPCLARMHENEDDKADAGQNQQNQEDDYQGIQRVTLPLRFQCFAYAS